MVRHAMALGLLASLCGDAGLAAAGHFADADNAAMAGAGKQAYAAHCAACHGRFLQGQPLWRMADEDRPRRAPALDGTGPGWRHSDDELFGAVREGHYPGVAAAARSRMPAFGAVMEYGEILATLAFIKNRWPTGQRVAQARLNGGRGLPRDAGEDWRFPADCKTR